MDAELRALADGTRRRILKLVWREERSANNIASKFKISRPAVSQHIKVLIECELITLRRAGTHRLYRVNHAAMSKLQNELSSFWDAALPNLKLAIEQDQRRKRWK
jgi:DNA-binding transcriptional ArsR family regulator